MEPDPHISPQQYLNTAAPRAAIRDFHAPGEVMRGVGFVHGIKNDRRLQIKDFDSGRPRTRVVPTYRHEDLQNSLYIETETERFVRIKPPQNPISHSPAPGDMCIACEDLELKNLLTFVSGRKHHLGWYKDISNCRHCALCRLLAQAFRDHKNPEASENYVEEKDYFILLTTVLSARPPPPRRQNRPYQLQAWLLNIHGNCLAEVNVRLVADSAVRLKKSARFHGRHINQNIADLTLAQSWIEECMRSHDCAKREATKNRHVNEKLKLIDVEQRCLVDMSWNSDYVALSYVWPRFKTTQLTKDNHDELHQPGSIDDSRINLPRVITDAMYVVLGMGKRYLWVDALCIVQDDAKIKDSLIGAMDQVYGRAIFTLIVASECDPSQDYGIPGINGLPRTASQISTQLEGLNLVKALPDYDEALQRSVWSTRGWTFQEGILSRRCLIFTDQQVYFRCARDARCEDVQAEGLERYEKHTAKPLVRQGQLDYLMNDEFLERVSSKTVFQEYALLASGYSSRNLTFETDVLSAFHGIMRQLVTHVSKDGFFCGLPRDAFQSALLWYPTGPLRRRLTGGKEKQIPILPTWTWAAWVGKIDYETTMVSHGDQEASLPVVQWWYRSSDTIVPIQNFNNTSPGCMFSIGILQEKSRHLHVSQLILWGTCIKLKIAPSEETLHEWMVDHQQTVPCFAILDPEGDSCGMLPSADRAWAESHKSHGTSRFGEFLLLSYGSQTISDASIERAKFLHKKYSTEGPFRCFYNAMLVEQNETGAYERKGIARIHRDAVNEELRDRWERKIMTLT